MSVAEHVEAMLADKELQQVLREMGITLTPGLFQRLLELNPYAYVGNNPLRWIDSTGFAAEAPDSPQYPPYTGPPDLPLPGVYPELLLPAGKAVQGASNAAKACRNVFRDPCNRRFAAEFGACLAKGYAGRPTEQTLACIRQAVVRWRVCRAWGGGGLIKND